MKKVESFLKGVVFVFVAIGVLAFIWSEIDHKKDIEWINEMKIVNNQMRQMVGPSIENPNIFCPECVGFKLCVYCGGSGWFDRKRVCLKCCNGICCRCGGTGLK